MPLLIVLTLLHQEAGFGQDQSALVVLTAVAFPVHRKPLRQVFLVFLNRLLVLLQFRLTVQTAVLPFLYQKFQAALLLSVPLSSLPLPVAPSPTAVVPLRLPRPSKVNPSDI